MRCQRRDSPGSFHSVNRHAARHEWLCRRFTIDAEHGDQHYSYSQPFFLSHTQCHAPDYSASAMADLFERAGLNLADYPAEGLFVLRATVMSPFHVIAAETGHSQSLLAEFVATLASAAEEGISRLPAPARQEPIECFEPLTSAS